MENNQNCQFFSTPKNNLSKESDKSISKNDDGNKSNLPTSDQSNKEEASALPVYPPEDSNQVADLPDKLLGEEVAQDIDKVSNINPHKSDYFDGQSYFDSPNFFDNTETSYH